MNINQLMNEWQQQEIPAPLAKKTMEQAQQLDKRIRKENTWLTYLLAGTIFFLMYFVFPLILNHTLVVCLFMAVIFLIGLQAMILWHRNIQADQAMVLSPTKYLTYQIKKLRYNLLVTNFFTPLYLVLLGALMSAYQYHLLQAYSITIAWGSIAILWLFLIVVFYFGWKKQRQKDKEEVIPLLKDLEERRDRFAERSTADAY